MIAEMYKTESIYDAPLHNNADTISAADRKPLKQFLAVAATATAAAVSTVACGSFIDVSFPTAHTLYRVPISPQIAISEDEPFEYENRDEVLEFISDKPDVKILHQSLPSLIESVFGKTKVRISIIRYDDENWSNLRVDIESGHEIEKLSMLEDLFFTKLEKEASLIAALEYTTVCFG